MQSIPLHQPTHPKEFIDYFIELEKKAKELQTMAAQASMYTVWGHPSCEEYYPETIGSLMTTMQTIMNVHSVIHRSLRDYLACITPEKREQ